MQIFLFISCKWRTFTVPSDYPINKDRRRSMFGLMHVYIYLKIYKYTRRSALKILHRYYWYNYMSIDILNMFSRTLFLFAYYLTWQFSFEIFHSLQFNGGSVNAAVAAARARETGSWSRIVSNDVFLPGRFLKAPNSRASVVEYTTGCHWGGFCFYFFRMRKRFHLLPFFSWFTVIYLLITLTSFDVAVEFYGLTHSFLVTLCRVTF